MKYSALPALLAILFSCDPGTKMPEDAAARASGEYEVQSYVVNGDTLYNAGGTDKIGLTRFYISVGRNTADSLNVGIVIHKKDASGGVLFVRKVGFTEAAGTYELHLPQVSPGVYKSTISGGVFEEKTAFEGIGYLLLPSSYQLNEPEDPALRGVRISAKK